MNNETTGKELKKLAKAGGNFVKVDISNLYNTLNILSYFFYRKKHEWIAICFFDEEFICRLMWFNKGANHQTATIGLPVEKAIAVAKENNIRYIVLSHNHPVSSKDIPDYGLRRLNIQASYELKAGLLGFSEQDKVSGSYWQNVLQTHGIGYADAVFVAGNYELNGNAELVDNYSKHKPSTGCYVATEIFGMHSYETNFLRTLRDEVLINCETGKIFCKSYYYLSQLFLKYISKFKFANYSIKKLILLFICLSIKWSNRARRLG